MNGIVLSTLRELAGSGAVRGYTLQGQVGGYTLAVRYGMSHQVLMAKRGEPRLFVKIETGFELLRSFGVTSVEVILAGYEPKTRSYNRGRPEALRALSKLKKTDTTTRSKILPTNRAQMRLPGLLKARSKRTPTKP